MPKRSVCVIVILVVTGLVFPVGWRSVAAQHPAAQYTEVRILAQWSNRAEQGDFQTLLLPFFQDYNVQPTLIAATDLDQTLQRLITAGTPPDIVLMTQPGVLRQYAVTGALVDLGAALGNPPSAYPSALAEPLSVDGTEYGRLVRLTVKGLAWISIPVFLEAGFTFPGPWNNLIDQSETIAEMGTTPWALGLSDPAIGTDLLETILLNEQGADVLEGLAAGSIPWTDGRVRDAWAQFGDLLDTGIVDNPTDLSPLDAALALFDDPPGAYYSAGTSATPRGLEESLRGFDPDEDLDFFWLGNRIIVGGEFVVLFNDDPVTLQLAEFLTSQDTAAAWAALGSAISPYPDARYPNTVMARAADVAHKRDVTFDLSDQLHPDVRDILYGGIWRYVDDRGELDDILIEIEAAVGKTR